MIFISCVAKHASLLNCILFNELFLRPCVSHQIIYELLDSLIELLRVALALLVVTSLCLEEPHLAPAFSLLNPQLWLPFTANMNVNQHQCVGKLT